MTTVALALATLHATGNARDLGVILAANLVPTIVLLLIGGVVSDRWSRRDVLVGSNLVSAGAMGALAALLASIHFDLLAAASCSAVSGAASAFSVPALRGVVPQLVPQDSIQRANALLASVRNAVRIIAPSVAAVLVVVIGGAWAVALDALTYLVAAAAYTTLPSRSRVSGGTALWHDLREGWSAFVAIRWVLVMACCGAVLNAANVGPWNVLGPLIIGRTDGQASWGAVLSIRSAGLLVASAVVAKIHLRHPLCSGRLVGTLAMLPLVAMGLRMPLWTVLIAAFLGGMAFTVAAVTWETAIQTEVPQHVLSRVTSYDDLLSFVAIPLSQLASGPLADRFGAERVALGAGAIYALGSLTPLLRKDVRVR